MTVLVTGGAGYIGSHMVLELMERREHVVVLDNLTTGFARAIPDCVDLVVGDIADVDLVERLVGDHKIDAIFHFAGSVVVPDSVSDPLGYYANNTINTHKLIASAVKLGVKQFIFSSTAAVYGLTGKEPVKEDVPLAPDSPYGWSKLMSERILQDACAASDLNYAILRYFNVAGSDPQGRAGQSTEGATHLIKVACEAALGRRPFMEIFGDDYDTPDGTGMRDFIHVSDLVTAHGLALDYLRDRDEGIIANLGYGHGHSVRQIIDCVEKLSNSSCHAKIASRRPGDLEAVFADPTRARIALGWSPQYDNLETIVSTALAWENKSHEIKPDA